MKTLLARAGFYSGFAAAIGARRGRSMLVRDHIRPNPGDRILDIGCGPADILEALPDVEYFGFDLSGDYIASARRRFAGRGQFSVARVDAGLIDQYRDFDLALANGVVHHLNDAEAVELFRIARTALKPGGRLITLDGCFAAGQSRIARFLIRQDRGHHVRTEPEYVALAASVFDRVTATVRHDLLRMPYTHIILECSRSPAPAPTPDPSSESHVH